MKGEDFAQKFAEFLQQRGLRARPWKHVVYLPGDQSVSMSRDGDVSNTFHGKFTFRREALWPSWRIKWDLAMSDYEAWREGTRAERERQAVLPYEAGDWFDVTDALRGSTKDQLEKLKVAQERGLTDFVSYLLLQLGGVRLHAVIRSAAKAERAEVEFIRLPTGDYRVFARDGGVK